MLKKQFKIENKIYKDELIKSAIKDFADFDIVYNA